LLLSLDVPLGDQPEGPEAVAETDLANLQKALRDNRPTPSLNGDGSISIHSCHSAIREVEVLQQQLLLLLEQEPGLVAEDILVLCPEMERYAELIDSVFSIGTQVNQAGRVVKIPYSGVAMTGSLVGEAVQFLESLMGFVLGKQSLSELGDLLGREPVLHSIDLELSELRDLLDLLYTTGVRRGSGFSLTPGPAGGAAAPYTLASGLERIYLGQSFPDSILSRGAPFSLDVREAEVMGLLLQKIEPLLQLAEEAKNARQPPGNWQERLLEAARPLLGGSREAGILLQINSLLNDTAFMAAPPVRFRTYAQRLNSRLDGVTQGRGVFRRGVSFCRLQEGRGLPAKVLVLLGMNEGSLPRKPFYCDYDLMARQSGDEGLYRRREVNLLGDPSMRDEDRQAFLESLMDAGERLIILYTGQSELTNEELPPAVVVTDLIQESATLKPLKHPLHEWSFSNFDRPQPAPLESPEPIHFDARLLRRSDAAPAGFLDSSPEAAAVLSTGEAVSVRQLHRFLKDPAQDYLRRQHDLEVTSGDEEADWEDRLPLSPDGLESWKLRERFVSLWLEAWEAGIVPEERPAMIRQRFLDEQLLPPGALGAALWSKRIAETAQRLQTHLSGEDLRVVPVTTVYASGTVTSEVLVDSSNRRILPLNGAITSANWLLHVFLNLNGVGGQYCLLPLEKGNVCHWKVDDPFLENYRKWMSGILDLYRKNGDRLLPFSPNVAHAFAQARAKDPEEDESWQLETAVSKQWAPRYGTGDLSPAMLLCYGSGVAAVSTEDNGQATRELARQIFGLPLEWLDSLEGSDA
jgi:exodeoxyribonuclease V gamma subunit